jgi:hypothetical protein
MMQHTELTKTTEGNRVMMDRIDPAKKCAQIVDDKGRVRGLLEDQGDHWFYVYNASGYELWGAGRSLQAAIDMVMEKSGMAYEALPPITQEELTVKKGPRITINGFQGGGYYQHIFYHLGDKCLGSFYTKQQPARRILDVLTCVEGSCVKGHDLRWLLQQHGYRLANVNQNNQE